LVNCAEVLGGFIGDIAEATVAHLIRGVSNVSRSNRVSRVGGPDRCIGPQRSRHVRTCNSIP
jgi:hypothetical protein